MMTTDRKIHKDLWRQRRPKSRDIWKSDSPRGTLKPELSDMEEDDEEYDEGSTEWGGRRGTEDEYGNDGEDSKEDDPESVTRSPFELKGVISSKE